MGRTEIRDFKEEKINWEKLFDIDRKQQHKIKRELL